MMLVAASQTPLVPHGLTAWDWVQAGIILAVTIVISQLVRRLTVRAFGSNSDRAAVQITGRFLAYLVVAAGFVYMLSALRVQIGPLIGALGIGGIALAFALQDILQNLVAGIILQTRRPIRRGDQVEVGSHQGVVRDIDLRTVLIRTFDGLDVFLPNKTVLENPIVNYTMTPTRRITLNVGVAYDSDLASVQQCLVKAVSAVPGVLADPAPAAWVTSFGPSSIDFAVLMWFQVATASLWQVQSDAAVAVKAALDGAGVEIPFPQRTLSLDPRATRMLFRRPSFLDGEEPAHEEPAPRK